MSFVSDCRKFLTRGREEFFEYEKTFVNQYKLQTFFSTKILQSTGLGQALAMRAFCECVHVFLQPGGIADRTFTLHTLPFRPLHEIRCPCETA